MKDIKFKVFSSPWVIKFKENVFTLLEDGRDVWAFGIAEPSKRIITISTKNRRWSTNTSVRNEVNYTT